MAELDTIEGGAGADTIVGGQGNRALEEGFHNGPFASLGQAGSIGTASYASSTGAVSVNLASGIGSGGDAEGDRLYFINDLIGGSGNDTLIGDVGGNSLAGGLGDDLLAGGDGSDTLDGGAGNNTASFADSPWAISAHLDGGISGGGFAADLFHIDSQGNFTVVDTLLSIQNLIGSDYADELLGDANANVLAGGADDDTIWGSGYLSNAANDTIYGGAEIDTLVRGDWSDEVEYSTTADGMIVVTNSAYGSDTISGIEFIQFFDGRYEMNFQTGGGGNDTFYTTSKLDVVFGGTGDDTFFGFGNADWIDGGTGHDTLLLSGGSFGSTIPTDGQIRNIETVSAVGANSSVIIKLDNQIEALQVLGSSYNDTIYGGLGSSNIDTGDGNDYVEAFDNLDTLVGGSGNDTLYGLGSSDRLYGGADNDALYGGSGTDTIYGDAGNDFNLRWFWKRRLVRWIRQRHTFRRFGRRLVFLGQRRWQR